VTQDEWRVEIDLDDEEHGYTLGERLRSQDLDDEARERLGRRVIVTRDGSKVFLYATDEAGAREAERVARELLEADRLTARVTVTRWDPDAEEWIPVGGSEPGSGDARRSRPHPFEWEVDVNLPSREAASELEQRLKAEGLPVHRLWRRVTVDARTAGEAEELAERLRAELPAGTEVWIEPNPDGLPHPAFVWLETRV
jgi:hypothetical protein